MSLKDHDKADLAITRLRYTLDALATELRALNNVSCRYDDARELVDAMNTQSRVLRRLMPNARDIYSGVE